ncbi:MAG TPA: HIT domain-containing protein [Ghiorsea sp.]|nr:HIT domain-containing protein [Ghiorsea sp.]HIP07426.1 HIT domain-containing protein [Mariprofundaceae bacterium]
MILHPQLKKDCFVLGRFDLCLLLLINDSQYPWFILVPQRENISEIHQLTTDEQYMLIHESSLLAQAIEAAFTADKINVAALGNVVPQLHIHHIVRYTSDIAWPKPVWGAFPSKPYTDDELSIVIKHVQSHLPTLQAMEQS